MGSMGSTELTDFLKVYYGIHGFSGKEGPLLVDNLTYGIKSISEILLESMG